MIQFVFKKVKESKGHFSRRGWGTRLDLKGRGIAMSCTEPFIAYEQHRLGEIEEA